METESLSQTLQIIKNIVEVINEEDIYKILNEAINFSEKFEILFYTKKETKINGYIIIRNRTFYFEIRLYKLPKDKEFTIGITIGKINIVKKVAQVIWMGKKPISFKADDELIREIEKYAYKKRISRGEAIRRAIENFLEEELEKETDTKAKIEKIS